MGWRACSKVGNDTFNFFLVSMLTLADLTKLHIEQLSSVRNNSTVIKFSTIATKSLGFISFVKRFFNLNWAEYPIKSCILQILGFSNRNEK